MPHTWQYVGGGVQDTGDGYGKNLLIAAEIVGALPGAWIGVHGGVAADVLSE